ncbi:MAG: NCS2 family permease [Phycisphaerae bacterium]
MFHLSERGATPWGEIRGGLVTFLTLSYIVFVQPAVLSDVGMPAGDVFVATCVCSALACFLMAFAANYPFALAPAMGHNFFFAYTVCLAMGIAWPAALLANLIAGAAFLVLSFAGLREAVMRAVPDALKYAIAVGIGLLIAFSGLQWGGIVQNSPATLVQLGRLTSPVVLVSLAGVAIIAVLLVLRVKAAILLGILATAVLALAVSHATDLTYEPADGLEVIPASRIGDRAGALATGAADPVEAVDPAQVHMALAQWPERWDLPGWPSETLGAAVTRGWDLLGDRPWTTVVLVIFIFLFLDMFDTVGTLIGVGERAGFLDERGHLPRARQALFADAAGTVAGALVGTSTITTYIESAAGVESGARTGLASVVTGACLLLSLLLLPLVHVVGAGVEFVAEGTGEPLVQVAQGTVTVVPMRPVIAPVLILIGVMMVGSVVKIRWNDYTEAIPAFLAIVIMQFSFSITDGIAWGFIAFVLLKGVTRRWRDLHWLVVLFAALFIAQYAARAMLMGG